MEVCCHCSDHAPCASQIEIFHHLDQDSQEKISALARHLELKKGQLLLTPQDTPGLYLIAQGKVKVYELTATGKEKLLRVLGKGEFVGEEALFGPQESYSFAQALTDLRVCLIPRTEFLNLLAQYPSICLKLLEEFNRRLVRLSHQMAARTAGTVQSRLIAYLLELQNAQGSTALRLPLPMKELAASLETTPETLSRRLGALEDRGLLRKQGRSITLLEPKKLSALLDEA